MKGLFGLALIVALFLRVGYLWEYQHARPERALAVLPFLFEPGNIAASVAAGKGFSSPFREETGPTAWLTPVYPLILAGIFRVWGLYTFGAFLAAAGLNIVFSTLTIVPIYFVGRRVGGGAVGTVAAWLWAVFPNAIKLPVQSIWDASLAALLAALILWATLALADSRRLWHWCGYGLLWGFTLMTSAALVTMLPLLAGWLAWCTRRFAWALMVVGIAALCLVPWTIRNFIVLHSFVPLRSVAGLTLWLGNHDQSTGEGLGQLHPISSAAERAHYVEVGEIAYMREKEHEALAFIVDHPGAELRAAWYRFVAMWSGGSMHPWQDLVRGDWGVRSVLLFNLLAGVGALAGMVVLCRRGSVFAFPLGVFPAVFPVAYYLTLVTPRYRLPMDPVILLLAAVAVMGGKRLATNEHE